jgi:hypothetical protein
MEYIATGLLPQQQEHLHSVIVWPRVIHVQALITRMLVCNLQQIHAPGLMISALQGHATYNSRKHLATSIVLHSSMEIIVFGTLITRLLQLLV